MRVSSIRLQHFKRFTDWTIPAIPQSARLVVVVGPNGCGKSSLFDAFTTWYRIKTAFGQPGDHAYFVDEGDTHLHTSVQGALIRELTAILPEAAQLWVTTHSLGVIRAAQELEATEPGTVCVLNFTGVDQDTPNTITPATSG